jgi:hypothetical protein
MIIAHPNKWDWINTPPWSKLELGPDGKYHFYGLYVFGLDEWIGSRYGMGASDAICVFNSVHMLASFYKTGDIHLKTEFIYTNVVPVSCTNRLTPGRSYSFSKPIIPDFSMVYCGETLATEIERGDTWSTGPKVT